MPGKTNKPDKRSLHEYQPRWDPEGFWSWKRCKYIT